MISLRRDFLLAEVGSLHYDDICGKFYSVKELQVLFCEFII